MSGFVLYDPANQSTSLESFCVRTSKFAGEGRIPHPGRPNLSYPEVVPNETRDETRFTAVVVVLGTFALAQQSHAASCANGVYRAGCVGPNGAAVVRKP
jgi:hypothetical protein